MYIFIEHIIYLIYCKILCNIFITNGEHGMHPVWLSANDKLCVTYTTSHNTNIYETDRINYCNAIQTVEIIILQHCIYLILNIKPPILKSLDLLYVIFNYDKHIYITHHPYFLLLYPEIQHLQIRYHEEWQYP